MSRFLLTARANKLTLGARHVPHLPARARAMSHEPSLVRLLEVVFKDGTIKRWSMTHWALLVAYREGFLEISDPDSDTVTALPVADIRQVTMKRYS